ncbi:MAG TPA: amino acid adenylation domain-containing protein [Actinophytocola sp.]|uniref:non-ribosomal peptide synthetase n=1 Tax=Actinophytocola sp. TaxID=1872138 RepID=UPI002DDD28EE|nr:non-ribosomal peptide synthetase [Actinophytocola sp.]HEV2784624.1 amino acid adenylation domain-containing protein [Actinophytocola sp.]
MVTVPDLLQQHARNRAADRAFVFLDEDAAPVTYAELDGAARRVAAALSARGGAGEPVLLLYPPGRSYVEGFLGCLYAGAIAVPAYPPDPARLERTLPRLRALIADCGARLALTVSGLDGAAPAGLEPIATDRLPDIGAAARDSPRPDPGSPALLQYTSGSTGEPKGVLLSHANLVHNAELVRLGFGCSPSSVAVSWLPPYHDMGLIGGIVQPIYAGLPMTLMSPLTFLRRPMIWLETISRFGATVSGGPNFAFDLCVRKSTPAQRAGLDLSRWRVAFCGAEPVRAETLDRFAEAFAPAGFRREAFYPCYGLAEGTLIVTGGRPEAPPRLVAHDGTDRVGCGTALGDQTVAVVDPATRVAADPGAEGEIWVSGPSVGLGYWNRPEETARTFHARRADDPGRRYLRTGDLGFLGPDGELVVTGRVKDLIIIRGRNVYPQDLEQTVERVDGVRAGCSAAFPIEQDGAEAIAIACEVTESTVDLVSAIRRALAEAHELDPAAVVLLRPRSIPKTSSGKIQRHACRKAFLDGGWDVLARWDRAATDVLTQLTGLPADTPLTELGLDSLRAVELRHALQERGVDVSISELLGAGTIGELRGRRPAEPSPIPTEPGLSDGQRALWFMQRWAPTSTAYQITRAARIRSPLDVSALRRAFRALVDRHPALRTRLPADGGEPVRREFAFHGEVLEHHDLSACDETALRQRVEADAAQRFDLAGGPLFRAALYSRGPADHVLLLSIHHVIADFWSLSVLVDDLLTLYAGATAGPAAAPAPAESERDIEARLEYWRTTMSGAPPVIDLPTTFPRPRVQSLRGAANEFRISPDVLRRLDELAGRTGTTRFVALLAGFAALLSRYAGEDVVIGTPTTGRDDRRTARLVDYLVNPVPLRVRVAPGTTFGELMARVRHTVLGALDHAVPFPRLVEAIRPTRDPSRSPVMQAALTLQQSPPGRPDLAAFAVADDSVRLDLGGLAVQPYRLPWRDAMFDLSLMAAEVSGGLSCVLEYCADLFDPPAMARIGHQLTTLLADAASNPDSPVETLGLLDEGEREAVLALADGGPPLVGPTTLPALFAERVARHGAATAVVCGGRTLSYAELDALAGRVAAGLRGRFGVRPGQVVGVRLPRGVDWVVAFWAVLRAGAVYLPLTPDLPASRLEWMIADARPAVVLGQGELAEASAEPGEPAGDAGIGPEDLAYVIYTSGSTGRPKGVLVPHRGLGNVAEAWAAAVEVTAADRLLHYASSSFDLSILEVLTAHLRGAALHLAPPDLVPGPDLVRLLEEQRITVASMSPSALAALPDAELPDLAGLIVGGEVCPAELVARWGRGRRFRNAYGPTETTICATIAACEPGGGRPPIGRPIPGVRTYVLDGRMRPVPIGMPGELYIGGIGVATGYLGRPGLTADRFRPDPFHSGRMYRTGDRVRWLPDGSLDFLGRLDDQVQIRGIRVEPGEIEVRLREVSGAREVAVVPRPGPGGGTELVAYLVPDGHRVPVAELRGRLRAELPGPWVPAAFVHLDRLPLTANGKLDRAGLPAPTPADRGTAERRAPRTELERIVARVWAAVLGQDLIGVRDHFFDELGGTSLLVARVTGELADRLGRDVPVTDLFEHPTVEALARHLARAGPTAEDTRPEEHAAARRAALARRARRKGA